MRHYENPLAGANPSPKSKKSVDWIAVIACAWALGFGANYAGMMLRTKAPALLKLAGYAWRVGPKFPAPGAKID